ncbi:MAG: ABC transporter ATP-binding protein/permease [Roseburia sp.]|nr:ABC transporter ATP-binding protein/permease [Roseburia sp.]MCM1096617.1 ABC transporter ATP-binding protein/permease [Ruminococcus flavefaciens]
MINSIRVLWKIAYRDAGWYGIGKNVLWLLYAVFSFLFVITLQNIYDALLAPGADFGSVAWRVVLFGGCLLMSEICMSASNIAAEDSGYLMTGNLSNALQNRVKKIEAIEFEKEDTLNQIQQARDGIENGAYLLNIVSIVFCYQIPYLILTGLYLADCAPVLIVLLLLVTIPICINQVIKLKEYEKIVADTSALEREQQYYKSCIWSPEYLKETRLLGAYDYFKRLFCETLEGLNRKKRETAGKMFGWGIVMQCITLTGYVGILSLMVYLACKSGMAVSAFYAILTALSNLLSLIEGLVGYYWGQISEQGGNVKYLVQFLKKNEEEPEKKVFDEDLESIQLENVSFRYPNRQSDVFQGMQCEFSRKETVAIVGENGAGKSTLMKLLSGLYRPSSGTIKYNHKNIEEYGKESLWARCSAVMQDYQRYKMTLRDNICLSEEAGAGTPVEEMRSDEDKRLAGMFSDVRLVPFDRIFKDGYDTMLSKDFGGIDLSGGQWQRIGIIRGMNKDYDVIFLDEPTAAIDPIEEAELYRLFLRLSKDKFSFIITHRLGICKFVDRILVLENGKIMEDGTHEELMAEKGKYYQMFRNQADLYTSNAG